MRHFFITALLISCVKLYAQFNIVDTVYQWDNYGNNYSYSSVKISDNKFVITAYAFSNDGNFVVNAFCIDLYGDTLWNRQYLNDTLLSPYIVGSILDNQKNIVMAGSAYNTNDSTVNGLLVKIDTLGNLFWMKSYWAQFGGYWGGLYGQFPIATNDNHYLNVCQNSDSGVDNFLIVKTDTNGNELTRWQYLNPHNYDLPICGLQSSDGGFVFAGYSSKFDTFGHFRPGIYVIKSDSAGNKKWETGILSLYSCNCLIGDAEADAVYEESDGYILAGERGYGSNPLFQTTNDPSEGLEKNWLGKISKTDGQLIWDQWYGIDSADYAHFAGFTRTADGGFVFCGGYDFDTNTANVVYIVETDSLGNPVWQTVIQHPLDSIHHTDQMELHKIFNINGGFLVTGIRWPGWPLGTGNFPYVMSIDSTGCWHYGCRGISGVQDIVPDINNGTLLLYPNPTGGLLYININAPNTAEDATFEIYDISGRLVLNQPHIPVNTAYALDVGNFANGMYFVEIMNNDNVIGRAKFVKE